VNAATQQPGRITPGEIITIYGTGLGPASGASFTVDPVANLVNFNLSGTQVYFAGQPGPVLYASATQVNAVVPDTLGSSGQAELQVAIQGILSSGGNLPAATAVPGIFTIDGSGAGRAVALNQDGTICDARHPAATGSCVTIYFTEGGSRTPGGTTGSVTGSVLERLSQIASVTVGGQPATVTFAGAAPYFVDGVGQLNIQLAPNTPTGPAQPVILTVGINSSPGTATIAVR